MSTYREIRSLVIALEQSSKVQERRLVADKLQQKLALAEVRARLAREAGSGNDIASRVRRRKALSELWRYIIKAAVVSTQKMVSSKVKLREADILMPFKLVRCCDLPYEPEDDVPGILPYRPALLSRSETKLVFNYCYDMLHDETALELAELQILENLAYLCSRKEYVANMRARREIHAIVQEVESRILDADQEPIADIRIATGKVFESIIDTACSLGIGMQLLLPGCVKMVAEWCSRHSKRNGNPPEMIFLMKGLSTLLRSDLHQSVAPLTRHGQRILTFARKAHASAVTSDSRRALNEYIYAHLLVAQTAGELQGLLSGDVGDLGGASLTIKHVNSLLDMLVGCVFKIDTDLDELSSDHRFQLELIARLLSCAQRMYLETASWTAMKNPTESLVSFIESTTSSETLNDSLTPKQLLSSPFWDIFRYVYPVVATGMKGPHMESSNPITQEMLRSSNSALDVKAIISVLRIVTACAHHHPSGQCWTSSPQSWHTVASTEGSDFVFINICSGDDLCLLIEILADLLEWAGPTSGNATLQRSVLQCFISMTKTAAVLSQFLDPKCAESTNLLMAWRRVWKILMKTDLVYQSRTKGGKSDCIGRLVLTLLREMIVRPCVDLSFNSSDTSSIRQSSFIFQHQSDVWGLPCYTHHTYESLECFLLIYSVLSLVGLSEGGTDAVEFQFAQELTGIEKIGFNRRSRLLVYCLRVVEAGVSASTSAVVAACLGALVYGNASLLFDVFQICSLRDALFPSYYHIPSSNTLCWLWMEPPLDPRIKIYPHQPFSRREIAVLDSLLARRERSIAFSDFVPDSDSSGLLGLVTASLSKDFLESHEVAQINGDDHIATSDLKRQFLFLRYRITILICSRKVQSNEQQYISSTLAHLLRCFSSGVRFLTNSVRSFWPMFAQMNAVVRALSIIASNNSIEWTSELLDEATHLSEICTNLLESKTMPKLRNSHSASEPSDDLFLEEMQEEETESSDAVVADTSIRRSDNEAKRKRRETSQKVSAKKVALDCSLPSPNCTIVVVALLMALNPSADAIIMAACKLMGIKNIETATSGDFDAFGAAVASSLMCMEESLLCEPATRTLKGGDEDAGAGRVVLVYRLLSSIRAASSPEDDFHLFGFHLCDKVVSVRDDPDLRCPLDSEESKCLVELLVDVSGNFERKSFQARPHARALQLQSAINAFCRADSEFHEAFDKEFARNFVLASLFDMSSEVRSTASQAVACAIRLLPEERVSESIRKRLFLFDCDGDDQKEQYRKWYASKSVGNGDLEALEKQVCEDAFLSMRDSSLTYWSVIAGESTNDDVLKLFVFDLLLLAESTPECEGLCLLALDRMARHRGEQKCEILIDHCVTYLVEQWLKKEFRLLDFPLIATSPSLVRMFLKSGYYSRVFLVDDRVASSRTDVKKIREAAAAEFISRFSNVILPLVLSSLVRKRLKTGISIDLRREFMAEPCIKEICSVYNDHFDAEEACKIVASNLPGIVAHVSWLSNDNEENRSIALQVDELVRTLLSDAVFLRRLEIHYESAQRHLLDASMAYSTRSRAEYFLDAHQNLSTMASVESRPASYVLLLYYARNLMSVRLKCSSADVVWIPVSNAIKLGQRFVENGPDAVPYFKITMQVLTSIMGDDTFQKVHTLCLHMLALLSEELFGVVGKQLISDVFGDILLVIFQVLDESIIAITEQASLSVSTYQSRLVRSLGLVGGYNLSRHLYGDTWGWCDGVALNLSMSSKPCQTRSCIVDACISFVSVFVQKCSHSESLKAKLIEAYRASRISSISRDGMKEFKSLLDIQVQIESLVDSTTNNEVKATETGINSFIDDVLGSGKNNQRGIGTYLKTSSSSFTTIDKKRIINKLERLENILHDLRKRTTPLLAVHSRHVQALGFLCSSAFPQEIRLAASRCFGELNMSKIKWEVEYPDVSDYWFYSAVKDNRLLRVLQARCIESLFSVLKSPNPFNSSLAAQTLTALLSTRVGQECRTLISAEASTSLEIFYSQSKMQINTERPLILDEHEISLLHAKKGFDQGIDDSWCWAHDAWRLEWRSSFEDWLCTIVPSILLCNYNASGESAGNDMEFFRLWQKITSLESNVAAAVFPVVIFDLLQNASEVPCDGDESDLINVIGSCFETLLISCTQDRSNCDRFERQYLDLILDTLEMLRQYTQLKFIITSRGQRKNHIADPISTNESDQVFVQKPSVATQSSRFTRAVPWAGLRFGVTLHLDGFLVTRAFLKAGRVAAAILYAELYADSRYGGSSWTRESINAILANNVTSHTGSGDISGLLSQELASPPGVDLALTSRNFLNTLRECYAELEEVDNLNALTQFVADIDVLSPENFLSMLRKKDDIFASISSSNEYRSAVEVADGLDRLGLDFALQNYISGATMSQSPLLSESDTKEMKEKWYKCQLFSMCWADNAFQENSPLIVSQPLADLRPAFFELMVKAVNAMEKSDYVTCHEHTEEARWNVVRLSFNKGVRSESETILSTGSYLRALNDLQRVTDNGEPESIGLPPALESCGEFRSQREMPLYCRELVLRHLHKRSSTKELGHKHMSLLLDQLWETSSLSLRCGDLQMASGALSRIHSVLKSEKESLIRMNCLFPMTIRLRMEETVLLEKSGNFTAAITSTQRTIDRRSQQIESLSTDSRGLLSEMMLNCSKWMAKYKTDPAHRVLKKILSPAKDLAISVLNNNPRLESNVSRASECLLTMSSLGHALFESGMKRVNSLDFQRAGQNLEARKKELDECKRLQNRLQSSSKQGKEPSDLSIYENNLTKEIRQIEAERSETLVALNAHLKVVLEATSKAFMIVGTNQNLGLSTFAYRLVGVWFSAIEENLYDDGVDKLMCEALERVPSFRFVSLANQLFARLETGLNDGPHRERIHDLIIKLCLDHPYQCLVHLIAACNGNNVGKGVDGRSAAAFLKNTSERKVEAANYIVHTVKQKDPDFVSCLFDNCRTLSDAYIYLAMTEVKRAQKISFATISSKSGERLDSCLGRKSRADFMPCIFTKPPPIRPGRDYGKGKEDPKHGERVLGFDSYFVTSASGVHVPKIVVCKGTKGGTYRQLVKGQDEIRQDAVMQQVFGLLNEFVAQKNQNSENSGKHALHQLITYTIVPLTPTNGVLEWVEDSAPFGELIVDKRSGLHSRYFPNEWTNKVCYGKLQDAKRGEQHKVFDSICSHHSPSFRYFFLERFGHVPEKWYDAKMRYTRSVAVSSMVGHILGIGDRHCSNILVHEKSGDVIHIDFGYVFEQGKLLAVPERVPFRLTRNIIDGMGITGTDGVFTRTAESTMYLLKSNTNALSTILSAMASDPLYKWSLSPLKTRNRRISIENRKRREVDFDDSLDSKEKNKAAARAISKVQEKLQGYEDGTAGEQQSVEGQVQLLINSARDHGNLSSMYPGWQPWV